MRESNSHQRFWRPLSYHLTNPLYEVRYKKMWLLLATFLDYRFKTTYMLTFPWEFFTLRYAWMRFQLCARPRSPRSSAAQCLLLCKCPRSTMNFLPQVYLLQSVPVSLDRFLAFWSSPHPISNSQLHTLLYFHLWPIYLVLFKGSYSCDGISHLEGGFTLRCLQRLSRPGLATLP